MNVLFALSPLIVLGVGALLIMMAEAFAKTRRGLALGATTVFAATAAFATAVWLYGVDNLEGTSALAPRLVVDRF